MSQVFDESVLENPKIKAVLAMLAEGKSQDEIVEHFGYANWKSVYLYFNRHGFRWDKEKETFAPYTKESETITSSVEDVHLVQTKAAKIVRQLSKKNTNIRQIAQQHRFEDVSAMGEYMKGHGYRWNHEENNYEYDASLQPTPTATSQPKANFSGDIPTSLMEYEELLQFLLARQEQLRDLLEPTSTGTLPRYTFRGAKVTKTLGLPSSVPVLLKDFSDEFNITQRAIMEIALAEFFQKYGYEEQLMQVLQN
ncbi:hypothetical protein MKZ20_03870 [Psychrobacillus sp. FSL K6-2684]|uniref:hypothetical protein n=1 Tax=unclassified Psychrobacillus TaxID=2636677 RepID=UPI0030F501CE